MHANANKPQLRIMMEHSSQALSLACSTTIAAHDACMSAVLAWAQREDLLFALFQQLSFQLLDLQLERFTAVVDVGFTGQGVGTMSGSALQASYAMSKRTSLHARYRDENADAAGSDRRQFGVGIEHNF